MFIANSISLAFAEIPDIYTQNSTLANHSEINVNKNQGRIGLALTSGGISYRDSNRQPNNRLQVLPLLEYQWANGWFAGTRQGIGFRFSQQPDLHYGVFLSADLGRPALDTSNGIAAIRPRPILGTFANYSLSREWSITSSLRYGSGDNRKGAVLELGTNYNRKIAPQLHLMAGVAASLANADYMNLYYGVTLTQSANSGYVEYSPSAGLKDTRANVMLRFDVSKEISISTGVTATQLSNTAKNSPLISKPNSVSGLFAASYAF